MLTLSWKRLGLAALALAGVQIASLGGAVALTLPVPTAPAVSQIDQSNGDVQEVRYYQRHRYYRYYRHNRYHRYYRPSYRGHHLYWRHPHYRYHRPGYSYYYGGWWYARPWWYIPAPRAVPHYSGSRHVNWCLSRYRSYNPATDMYLGFDGRYHRCLSPYR